MITVTSQHFAVPPSGSGVRRAPLLAVLDHGRDSVALVGQVEIRASGEIIAAVTESSTMGATWGSVDVLEVEGSVLTWIEAALVQVPALDDLEGRLSASAKAVAEASRDAELVLRQHRYKLENELAAGLRSKSGVGAGLLANLLELQLLASAAADAAESCVREGMYLWITRPDAYHRYRSHRDESLITRYREMPLSTWSWLQRHDAGIRQCEALASGARGDVAAVTNLLSAATTLATTREAESQQTLSTLLSVAALALGVPALLLALYSADRLVPLRSAQQGIALVPVMVSLLVAGFLATVQPGSTRRMRWIVWSLVILLISLLGLSGVIAP